jgi:hypothetical protein
LIGFFSATIGFAISTLAYSPTPGMLRQIHFGIWSPLYI